ncbi:MAG TPA: 2-dehydropantoate 2-reductase [Anaerolineales bacterium]|nr:2-dehydropantoate 2-reductase [Anaerolineales bacterium]
MPPESILILGTGALGSLFAGRLVRAGVPVTMLGSWAPALEALARDGVCLVREDGREDCFPVQAISDPADCAGSEIALVLVKSWQTARAAGQLEECLAPDGVALTLQNGHGNREVLAAALGIERVALGTTTAGATLEAPGRVRAGGEGLTTVERHPRLGPLVEVLRSGGFEVAETDSAEGLVWSKLVVNAAINPLTALLEVPNGALLEREETRALMAALAAEAAAVAAAQGIALAFDDPAAAAEAVARRTAANRSSMYQDILRGAPTEIDAICGAIVREGRRVGVEAPVNETVWRLVRAKVGKVWQNGYPGGA